MAPQKIHKKDMLMCSIVSSCGIITYNCNKHIANLIALVVGNTDTYVKTMEQFSKLIQNQCVEDGQKLYSYDVMALSTRLQVACTRRLEIDKTLHKQTDMEPLDIMYPLRSSA